MRVHFTNLGCKLNQAELERLARRFHGAGHEVVGTLDEADLHVVNTCTVTHMAARTSRKVARRGARVSPGLKTVLTGCYVAESPEEAASLAGVDLVVPNTEKESLLERVHAAFPEEVPAPRPTLGDTSSDEAALPTPVLPTDVPYVPLAFGNTRALVKVEDGCNVGCAFCIIPATRGRQVSRPLADVVAEVASMAEAGVLEVVVTGVQISHYRDGKARLYELTRALLEETGVPRLRLTSIAPWSFDERLFSLWRGDGLPDTAGEIASRRLCRHVHMSLQSGSDATLARMKRPYTAGAYAELVERIRAEVPGVAVTTDVIVGFPGETDEDFAESLDFVRRQRFAMIHAFPYSVREGTAAAEMPDQVPHEVKRERMAALLEVAALSEAAFRSAQVGRDAEVLCEERRDGLWHGTTDNYVRVTTEATPVPVLLNTLTPAKLLEVTDTGLQGVPA